MSENSIYFTLLDEKALNRHSGTLATAVLVHSIYVTISTLWWLTHLKTATALTLWAEILALPQVGAIQSCSIALLLAPWHCLFLQCLDRILCSRLGEPWARGWCLGVMLQSQERSLLPSSSPRGLLCCAGPHKEETTSTKALFIPTDPDSSTFREKEGESGLCIGGCQYLIGAPYSQTSSSLKHLHGVSLQPRKNRYRYFHQHCK